MPKQTIPAPSYCATCPKLNDARSLPLIVIRPVIIGAIQWVISFIIYMPWLLLYHFCHYAIGGDNLSGTLLWHAAGCFAHCRASAGPCRRCSLGGLSHALMPFYDPARLPVPCQLQGFANVDGIPQFVHCCTLRLSAQIFGCRQTMLDDSVGRDTAISEQGFWQASCCSVSSCLVLHGLSE